MAKLWLVPAQWDGRTVELHADRLPLEPEDRRERFLSAVREAHPRLLLSFKASLLLGDEALDACGTDETPFSLAQEGSIRLAAEEALAECAAETEMETVWPLSHCAEAYLHRLMPPPEALRLTLELQIAPDLRPWLQTMQGWLAQGRLVILLREDGSA